MDVKLISGRMLQYVMKDVIIIVHKSYFWKHRVMFFVWNTLLLSPISIFVGKKYFPTLTFVWCFCVMQLNRRRFVFYPAALFWYFTVLFCTCCRCHSSCLSLLVFAKKESNCFRSRRAICSVKSTLHTTAFRHLCQNKRKPNLKCSRWQD